MATPDRVPSGGAYRLLAAGVIWPYHRPPAPCSSSETLSQSVSSVVSCNTGMASQEPWADNGTGARNLLLLLGGPYAGDHGTVGNRAPCRAPASRHGAGEAGWGPFRAHESPDAGAGCGGARVTGGGGPPDRTDATVGRRPDSPLSRPRGEAGRREHRRERAARSRRRRGVARRRVATVA